MPCCWRHSLPVLAGRAPRCCRARRAPSPPAPTHHPRRRGGVCQPRSQAGPAAARRGRRPRHRGQEHELAERHRGGQQPVEHRRRECRVQHIGLRRAFGGEGASEAGGGEHAGFAGADLIKQNLAPGLRSLEHAGAAVDAHHLSVAMLALAISDVSLVNPPCGSRRRDWTERDAGYIRNANNQPRNGQLKVPISGKIQKPYEEKRYD